MVAATRRLQWSHLERHQNTQGHQAAAMAYQAGDAVALSSLGAPAAQAWEKVWSELSKGVAPAAGVDGVGCRNKVCNNGLVFE